MQEITHSKKFIDQFDEVALQKNAVWFSSSERMKMIVTYVNTVYKRNYDFVLVRNISRNSELNFDSHEIGAYRLVSRKELI